MTYEFAALLWVAPERIRVTQDRVKDRSAFIGMQLVVEIDHSILHVGLRHSAGVHIIIALW